MLRSVLIGAGSIGGSVAAMITEAGCPLDVVAQAMGLDVPRFNVLPKNSFIAAHDSRLFNIFMGRFLEIGMGIKSGKVHPSTLQSLEKGKKTEIDIVNNP